MAAEHTSADRAVASPPVRVLCVGNMYPPHHLGGYDLVWQGAVRALREAGHGVRVPPTDFRLLEAGPHVEQPLGHLPRASSSAWYQRSPSPVRGPPRSASVATVTVRAHRRPPRPGHAVPDPPRGRRR